jgi:hypothetical protein
MFLGDRTLVGSAILSDIVILAGFLTTILHFAQDETLEIPALDVLQTLFCWPSFFEGLLATLCLWSFRHIERMLGLRGLVIYLVYNAITYSLPFFIVLLWKGFHAHFSLLNFLPYSLYVFMFWRIPAVMFADPLTDKVTVSLSLFLIVVAKFPYSLLALLAAAAGYWLWSCDILQIRYLFRVRVPQRTESESEAQHLEFPGVGVEAAEPKEETDAA